MARRLSLVALACLLAAACGSTASTPSPSAAPGASAAPAASAASAAPATSAPSAPGTSAAPSSADPAAVAQAFILALAQGNDAAAQAMENGEMLAAAPADKLGTLWSQFVAQFGPYGRIGAVTTATQAPYTIATVHTIFASGTVALSVAIDASGKVAGLHVASVPSPASPAPSTSPAG